MYQQNQQWTIYVKYRHTAIVISFNQCLDLLNAIQDQHPEGVISSRCSLMPCPAAWPKVFYLAL